MLWTMSLMHGWLRLRLPIQSNRHTAKPLIPYAFFISTDAYPDVILGATHRDVPQNCGATGCTDALHGFI